MGGKRDPEEARGQGAVTLLLCPVCEDMVPHDRGYLKEHYKQSQRGILTTGNKAMCDGSNTKPPQHLKTVRFSGTCPSCLTTNQQEFRETYPGSLAQYGGVIVQNCTECGVAGQYCSVCEHQLHEQKTTTPVHGLDPVRGIDPLLEKMMAEGPNFKPTPEEEAALMKAAADPNWYVERNPTQESSTWVNGLNEELHDDGTPHQPVPRAAEDRPVILTDSHVIRAADDDDAIPSSAASSHGYTCHYCGHKQATETAPHGWENLNECQACGVLGGMQED